MRKHHKNSKGFTLIELMIVVVIIGILAAIAIPKFTSVSRGAKQAEAAPVLKQICSLAESQFMKDSAWPTDAAAIDGWDEPADAEYFDFSFSGATMTATATSNATGDGAGLVDQTLNCDTGVMSDPDAAPAA